MTVNYDFDVALTTGQRMESIVRGIIASEPLAVAFGPLPQGRIDITPPPRNGTRRTICIISQPIRLGHLLAVTDGTLANPMQDWIDDSINGNGRDMKSRIKALLQAPEPVPFGWSNWFDPAVVFGHESAAFAPDITDAAQFPMCQMLGYTDGDIEVKSDEKSRDTGNLYLEFEQQGQHATSSTPFRPSGYAESSADLWIHVAGMAAKTMLIFLMPMDGLKAHIATTNPTVVLTPSDNPSHGHLLPIASLVKP